jgi:homoserine dehydrogenase
MAMGKVAIIGKGTIGKRAIAVAPVYGHEVALIVGRKGIMRPDGTQLLPFGPAIASDLASICRSNGIRRVMIAIPSGGTGEVEADYINAAAAVDCRIVTAGKSALANQFDLIESNMSKVAFDAACGAGAMIPSFLDEILFVHPAHPFVLTAVMNGTLNYAQSRVPDAVGREQIVDECESQGFCEPAEPGKVLTCHAMYNAEFDDLSRKIAILGNTRLRKLFGRTVTQDDFEPSEFTEDDLLRVTAGNSMYRYLVRICVNPKDLEYFADIEVGGRICARIGDVSVVAGFVQLTGALLKWVPNHVGNACASAKVRVPCLRSAPCSAT